MDFSHGCHENKTHTHTQTAFTAHLMQHSGRPRLKAAKRKGVIHQLISFFGGSNDAGNMTAALFHICWWPNSDKNTWVTRRSHLWATELLITMQRNSGLFYNGRRKIRIVSQTAECFAPIYFWMFLPLSLASSSLTLSQIRLVIYQQ